MKSTKSTFGKVSIFLSECENKSAFSGLRRALILSLCFLLLSASVYPIRSLANIDSAPEELSNQDSSLRPGERIDRGINRGQKHKFRISLETAQYLRVTIEQYDVDATVKVLAPDGSLLIEKKNPYGRRGTSSIAIETETSGDFVIEVSSSADELTDGRYSIKTEGGRAPESAEINRIKADKLVFLGNTLLVQRGQDSLQQAIAKYNESIPVWQGIGDRDEEAKTLMRIGIAYRRLQSFPQAMDFFEQSLQISRNLEDRRGEATALRWLALVGLHSDQNKARIYLDQALARWKDLNDKVAETSVLNMMGGLQDNLGESRNALAFYLQALELRRSFKDWRGLMATLNNIGTIYSDLSEWQKAIDSYEEGLETFQILKDVSPQDLDTKAKLLNNLGYTYSLLGDMAQATIYYGQALELLTTLKDRATQATTLSNIGHVEFFQGNYPQSLEAYNRALTLQKELVEKKGEAYTLRYRGYLNATLGKPQEALKDYLPALDILKEQEDRKGQAALLDKIGEAYTMLARYDDARRAYDEALPLWQFLEDQRGQALTLAGMARLERKQGNLDKARINIEKSLDLFESLRTNVTSQQFRVSYFASVQDYYNFGIDLFMQMHKQQPTAGYDVSALRLVEKSRSRSLLETIAMSGTDFRESASPDLLRTERELQEKINVKFQRQIYILQSAQTASSKTQLESLKQESGLLLSRLTEVQEKIRFQSPQYAALTQSQPLSLKEIQQQVLDHETTLLEYQLGKERSYLWLITQSEIKSFELPGQSEIETSAKKVHGLISTNRALFDDTLQEYWKEAANLSRMILSQAAPYFVGKRLLVVSEGALQYVPFKALPFPGNTVVSSATKRVLLIDKFDVVSMPSASVMAVMRRQFAERKRARKILAVLADPVFGKEDERFKDIAKNAIPRPPSNEQPASEIESRSPRSLLRSDLHRLKKSREEAQAIASLVDPQKMMLKLDFQANRENARGSALSDYRIIHFATHGEIDSRQPDLSKIVLSLLDEEGKIQDGFLRLNDIYNLKLNADLVVLSACETALGKDIKGEGLVGLTRGFMYAGAARVVASLWKVDDTRTARLMKRFYENMIKNNMEPSEALRAAQLEMWHGQENSPYYWAAFVLQGEWRNQAK